MAKKKKTSKAGGEEPPAPVIVEYYGRARGQSSRMRSGLRFGAAWAKYDGTRPDPDEAGATRPLTEEEVEAIREDPFIEFSESKPRKYGEE